MKKDISKVSIGFIPDLSSISKDSLVKHLVNKGYKFTRSSANRAITNFMKYVENEFWCIVLESVKKFQDIGVNMHILGLGVRRVFFTIAYSCGDDPALHRFCNVFEGNAKRSCIRCQHSSSDGIYNMYNVLLRDNSEILHHNNIAISATLKKYNGIKLNVNGRLSIKWTKTNCLHVMEHCTNNLPMGCFGFNAIDANNIYSTSCDILHTFECGLFKNVLLWTMSIIVSVAKLNKTGKYLFATGLLDMRLASFKHFSKVPNVTLYYFKKGISFIMKSKANKEKLQSTGGAGGFRSVEYVTLLIQMFMAVSISLYS